MKKLVSLVMIAILAFSIFVSSTAHAAVVQIGIITNSDYTSGKTVASKDQIVPVGSKIQLHVFILTGGEISGDPIQNVLWSTSNVQSVAISETGLVTALKAGTSTLYATYSGVSASIKITVEDSGTPTTDVPTEEPDPSTGGGSGGSGSGSGGSSSGGSSSGGSGSGSSSSGGQAVVEAGFADFSNAKFEVEKYERTFARIKVTGATTDYTQHLYIHFSENPNKPTIDGDKVNGVEYSDGIPLQVSSSDNKVLLSHNISNYVEENKDYYYSIVQLKSLNEAPYHEIKVLGYGYKINRYAEPKYSDAFFATFIAHSGTQVVTNFTHHRSNNRKMQIKVGKITDTTILNKIKNKDSTGFADLLTYAKSNSGIFDKVFNCDEDESSIEYSGGTTISPEDHQKIELKGKLNDGEYYFLYVKPDNENGKYISTEGVTLAQADVFNNLNGEWYLHFYGEDKFKWADFGVSGGDVLNGNLDKDDPSVTPDKKLPQTGMSRGVVSSIAATFVLMGISFIVYERNRDLR